MQPVFFVDYGGTIDTFKKGSFPFEEVIEQTVELLDTLKETKDEGAIFILATDNSDGDLYKAKLKMNGYDLFSNVITMSTFELMKENKSYWPAVLDRLKLNAEQIVLLDDDEKILDNAKSFGITTISSRDRLEAKESVKKAFQKISNL